MQKVTYPCILKYCTYSVSGLYAGPETPVLSYI